MTYVPFTQLIFLAAFAASSLFFLAPEAARADTRPCNEEELALIENDDDGLPVICDVMTVTAKRSDNPNIEYGQADFNEGVNHADFGEGLPSLLVAVSIATRFTM